ncbi:HYR domain-containing protein [Dokdonia sinensis]|uniref:HYR domain-containing protein n=1 Tax=Dokdonia sinensis TaxID=2479847 RepID=A0A3M0G1M9_9FLAO|nr:M36 family metallopeptidase [Dokdonia sinensis]RMB56092.1 HYR domain-containing protein [Dokdonia sinensis]
MLGKLYLKNKIHVILITCLLFISAVVTAQKNQVVNEDLQQKVNNGELSTQDILDWKITSEHISSTSGVHHIYYRQQFEGLEIQGAEASVHKAQNGKIVASHNDFIKNVSSYVQGSRTPQITPAQALNAAAQQLGYGGASSRIINAQNNKSKSVLLEASTISRSPVPAKLMYTYSEKLGLRLAWDMSIESKVTSNWWNVKIDASTGALLDKIDWMVTCSTEGNHVHDLSNAPTSSSAISVDSSCEDVTGMVLGNYEVFAMPDESPFQGTGARQIVANPDDGSVAGSPFGWHDTNGVAGNEFTITRGNNAHAYEDGDNSGFSPDGGANLDFTETNTNEDFSFDENYSTGTQSEAAAVVNIFYWSNIIHDILYVYGMDEAAGNFQQTNYSGSGFGNDYVRAEAQDGSGTCNANFGTPPDGSLPRMQMYTCNSRDGDFDNGVVIHEYGHGISTRLTGGGGNSGCLSGQEQMGEGWSDWYALMLTLEPGDAGDDSRGIGNWLFGNTPNGGGIRPQPYSTDLAVNSQTYDSIKTAVAPHGVGSVWSETLWEMTWALIDVHGVDNDIYNFTGDVNQDAGNVQAMALVTEGLKLQPCGPGFVDGRDAILAADEALYDGANYCTLWTAFAKRGLGFSATQGSSSSKTDNTEAFDMPAVQIQTVQEICVNETVQVYGDAFPNGGTFSGPGVTDNGDGVTYTFDPAAAGIGMHTITYTAPPLCSGSTTGTSSIEVTSAVPDIVCQDITIDLDENGEASIAYFDIVQNLQTPDYEVNTSGAFSPIDITTSGTQVFLSDDDLSDALPIGFSFEFYGIEYTEFYISSNGFLTFTPQGNGCCRGGTIPFNDGNNNIIAVAWDDLNPNGAGAIRYETIGTAPNRKLIMEYDEVPFFGQSDLVDAQVHLIEGTTRIEIHTTRIDQDPEVTQGIENINGTKAVFIDGRVRASWSATNEFISFELGLPQGFSNCGTETGFSLSQSDFTCGDVGENAVTITITDENGNENNCTATVTVNSGSAPVEPVATCQNIIVQLDANGVASITAQDVNNGSSLCGGGDPNLAIDITNFDCSNIGDNTVQLTVSDNNGNSATCTATVTVEDNIAPTVACQPITVQLDSDGNAAITAAQVDNGSSDFCGIDTITLSATSFTCSDVGENTVSLTVTDVNGNSETCETIVTVQDNVAPAVVCQNLTVELDEAGVASITASDIDNGSSDVCGIDSLSLDVTSFTCDDIGANTITLTVTDSNGNSATCQATVTVEDNTPLTVSGPGDISVETDNNDTSCETVVTYDSVIGTDNCGQDQITVVQIAGLGSGEVFPIGTTTETYEVTDADGVITTYSFDVVVTDGTDPEITNCPGNTTETVDEGTAFTIPDYSTIATFTDNCDDNLIFTQIPQPGVQVQPGTATTVSWVVADSAGNEIECSFTLAVEETLSVQDLQFTNAIQLFPNPVSEDLNVYYTGNDKITSISVYDVSGKVVQQHSEGESLEVLSMQDVAAGVYFVQVKSKTSMAVKRVIKK